MLRNKIRIIMISIKILPIEVSTKSIEQKICSEKRSDSRIMPSVLSTLATFDFRFRFLFYKRCRKIHQLIWTAGPPSLWAAAASPRDARGRRGGTWLWIATRWKVKSHGKKTFRTYLKVHFADWAFCDEVVVIILDNLTKACLSFLIWF